MYSDNRRDYTPFTQKFFSSKTKGTFDHTINLHLKVATLGSDLQGDSRSILLQSDENLFVDVIGPGTTTKYEALRYYSVLNEDDQYSDWG